MPNIQNNLILSKNKDYNYYYLTFLVRLIGKLSNGEEYLNFAVSHKMPDIPI